MLFTAFLVLGTMLGAASATSCNADNCLRAVKASAFPTRMGTVDCSSYFMVTVTPATSTITTVSTAFTTQTTDVLAPLKGRDGFEKLVVRQVTVSPSDIPAYASACSGGIRYSSACSCIGVTHSTITGATPLTTTSTTTTTTVVTTSVFARPTLEVFQYSDINCQVPETPPSMIITDGQCVPLPFQISDKYGIGTFSPGDCDTTASQCTVYYYNDINCAVLATSNLASSTSCVDIRSIFSMELVCPLCPA